MTTQVQQQVATEETPIAAAKGDVVDIHQDLMSLLRFHIWSGAGIVQDGRMEYCHAGLKDDSSGSSVDDILTVARFTSSVASTLLSSIVKGGLCAACFTGATRLVG